MAKRRALTALLALALAALVVLIAPALRAAGPAAVPAPVGPGDVYLALGDSLVTGDEDAGNADGLPGYPAELHRILYFDRPLSYRNLGVSGATSASFIAGGQLAAATDLIAAERAAGRRVGLITLSIGGNDMVGTFLGQSPLTITDTLPLFRQNLGQILDALIGAVSPAGTRTADILVMSYYNPYPGLIIQDFPGVIDLPPGQQPIVTDVEVPRFNQVIAEVAAEKGVRVVDAYTPFLGRIGELTYVRIPYALVPFEQRNFDYHPRRAGHVALARAFAAATGYGAGTELLTLPLVRRP